MSYILLSSRSLVGFVYIPLILAGVMLLEQHLETFLVVTTCTNWEQGPINIWLVEVKDVADVQQCTGQPPPPVQNCCCC